jgi:hypothetical protein
LITNIQLAQRLVEALSKKGLTELQIKSWQEYAPAPGVVPSDPRLSTAPLTTRAKVA